MSEEKTDVIKDKNQHMGESSHVNVIKNNGTINYHNNTSNNSDLRKDLNGFIEMVKNSIEEALKIEKEKLNFEKHKYEKNEFDKCAELIKNNITNKNKNAKNKKSK